MRATKNGWTIEGTPAEIVEMIEMSSKGDTCWATTTPAIVETEDKTPRKRIDWGKAQALKEAGWTTRQIADELGASYQTIYKKFAESES